MRERKLRSTAESLLRFRGSLIPYTCYIYKIKRKVKSKNTMRICSLSVPRLKHEWNQTVWSVNNLRCGTAGGVDELTRGFLGVSLLIHCGQNPFLQNDSKLGFYFAKHQAHARGLDIEDGRLGLEMLSRGMDLQQHRELHLQRRRSLQETPAQAQFCHTSAGKSSGRAFRSDLGTGAEC